MRLIATRQAIIDAMGLEVDEALCPVHVGYPDAWHKLLNWHADDHPRDFPGGVGHIVGFQWIEITGEGEVTIHYDRPDRPDFFDRPPRTLHVSDLPPIPETAWTRA